MDKLTYLLLFALVFSCCKEDEQLIPNEEAVNCEELSCLTPTEEFYGLGWRNGACWEAAFTYLEKVNQDYLSITLSGEEANGIGEHLNFVIFENTDLQDTIWLGWVEGGAPQSNVARARYYYTEDHSSVGQFYFTSDSELTRNDFLLIDDYSVDTTVVEGRFHVRFPERNINSFVQAPDTLRIQCGRFKAEEL